MSGVTLGGGPGGNRAEASEKDGLRIELPETTLFDPASDSEGIDIQLMSTFRTGLEAIQHLDIHVTLKMIGGGIT